MPRQSQRKCWMPAPYDRRDVRAIQALAVYAQGWDGSGHPPLPPSSDDVRRALDWIINAASSTYDNGFVPDDPNGRIAAYMDGRQSVGQQLVKLMKIKPMVVSDGNADG